MGGTPLILKGPVWRIRQAGLARTEGGKKPKLTIKAPSNISASGRVYCISLGAKWNDGKA